MEQKGNCFDGLISAEYRIVLKAFPMQVKCREVAGAVVAKYLEKFSHPDVLDLGVGIGFLAAEILKNNPNVMLIGVDKKGRMIKDAKSNLFIYRKRRTLVQDDAFHYLRRQKSESFAAVTEGFFLHNLFRSERQNYFAEIYRVLKTRGIFVVAERCVTNDLQQRNLEYRRGIADLELFFNGIGRPDLCDQWKKHHEQDEEPDRLMTLGNFEEDVREAGFGRPRVLFHDKYLRAISVRKEA